MCAKDVALGHIAFSELDTKCQSCMARVLALDQEGTQESGMECNKIS